ncbi:MAG: hypothetical protein DMF78_15080 [Acidobacteria bacterium]|nr:MAG: hypothetical protein DMF78_15080 [Acidobacteriota bacterium]
MSRIADLVARGVRITVGEPAGAGSHEISAETFEASSPRALARYDIPADIPDLAAVYEEAQVPAPTRGYGVDKMAEILESKRLAALPREVRVAAVLASLDAAGVTIAQVVRDAALREKALEGFVAAKRREADALKQRNDARVSTIRQETDAFVGEKNREIETLRRASDGASSAFSQLQLRKRQEAQRLREVLSHFVGDAANPIPAGASDSAPRNDTGGRPGQ